MKFPNVASLVPYRCCIVVQSYVKTVFVKRFKEKLSRSKLEFTFQLTNVEEFKHGKLQKIRVLFHPAE